MMRTSAKSIWRLQNEIEVLFPETVVNRPKPYGAVNLAALFFPQSKTPAREPGHNRPMILSAVDLGIEIDFVPDHPGATLQRKDKGHWRNYLVDGKPVTNPFDFEPLLPGRYRLVESPVKAA